MRFALTADQIALREAVRDLLAAECPPATVRAAWPPRRPEVARALWGRLAEMGVAGVAVPEAAGGLGLGACELVGILEEAGHAAVPLPVVETAFVAAPLLAAAEPEGERLERLLAGDLLVAAQLDGGTLVPYAPVADAILLGDARSVGILDAADATWQDAPSVDAARATARVSGTPAPLAAELAAAAWERGALCTAAQLVGLGRRLLEMTTEYVKERHQFGVAIGSFQAVKHHMANGLLALELAAPAVLRAAHSLDAQAPTAARDVAMAKALASDAAELVAALAQQCHGAIAYTVEYDLHLFAKRVWATSRTWGDADAHRARVGAALGLPS
jgi:alkylation response protein AidB-like acyl-CoA dehydrogenase